jgi:hypothetical protein
MSDGRKCPEYRPPATKITATKELHPQVSASIIESLGLPNETHVEISKGDSSDFQTTSALSVKFPGIHTSYEYVQLEIKVSPLPGSHLQPYFKRQAVVREAKDATKRLRGSSWSTISGNGCP